MKKPNYEEDLREIKDIMSRTTRFISLSGLSGISTGLIALLGAFMAYKTVFSNQEYFIYGAADLTTETLFLLLIIAVSTLILSICCAIYFTYRKTRIKNQYVWDIPTKRLLINLMIPLVTGGVLCLMLLFKGFIGILPSLTLIFYGLALVNASKYTFSEISSLGIIQIILGLTAFQFISYSLLIWALGFGIFQVIYGMIIQKKY